MDGVKVIESYKFKVKSKFACFDLDSTIINTKSGKKFPVNNDDWIYFNSNVFDTLQKLSNDGFSLIIITNQKNKKDISGFEVKIRNIFKNLEFKCFVLTKDNQFRKPIPELWRQLNYKSNNQSFYCGDAGGRKNDFSDTDAKFAKNCGLTFKFPEDIFGVYNENDDDFKYGAEEKVNFTYPDLTKKKTKSEKLSILKNGTKDMILLVGPTACGKSTFAEEFKDTHSIVNQDTLKSKKKCIKECNRLILKKSNIIIDNTNSSIDTRKEYIQKGLDNGYTVRCVYMTCPREIARHNALYRSYKNNWTKYISSIVYNIFYKNLVEPQLSEGFSEIVKMDFNYQGNDPDYFLFYY